MRRRAVVALAPGLAVGGECREAPSGNLRLARERLRLGADLGEPCPLAFNLAADGGKLRLDIRRRRQRLQGTLCLLARHGRLVAARGQPRLGLA